MTLNKIGVMCHLIKLSSGREQMIFWVLLDCLKGSTNLGKAQNIFANDIKCFYDSTNRLAFLT